MNTAPDTARKEAALEAAKKLSVLAAQRSKSSKALTPKQAAAAWVHLTCLEQLAKEVRGLLELVAMQTPFELPDGTRVLSVETEREFVDGKIAFGVLAEKCGTEVAAEACAPATSKTAILKALKAHQLDHLNDAILGAIRALGGCETKVSASVKEVRVRPKSAAASA